ncbi:hypothetical protein AGABI2DRAFT_178091 [Agaricus bisporus var. bisporus H97]|uniref:hypothetical protein n=1 Tax=Agaricus bisporus var. bisporus (strain H97 / ATCC MYA-4626 / FGSC 10389) TaxID=936046 RepID=UPI00029F55D7|nr:hypothetical protein AGABI2DRAFT_178091 [Agaricus bisporus var. bisporus H97]EKV48729.1 hypothetical protein AGABI2DRAFT_178091 [Agaricus bisporus var. bisporus H97]
MYRGYKILPQCLLTADYKAVSRLESGLIFEKNSSLRVTDEALIPVIPAKYAEHDQLSRERERAESGFFRPVDKGDAKLVGEDEQVLNETGDISARLLDKE